MRIENGPTTGSNLLFSKARMMGNIISLHKPSLQSPQQTVTTQAEYCELCERGLAEGLRLGAVGWVTRGERKGRQWSYLQSRWQKEPRGPAKSRRRRTSHEKVVPISLKNISPLRNQLAPIAH